MVLVVALEEDNVGTGFVVKSVLVSGRNGGGRGFITVEEDELALVDVAILYTTLAQDFEADEEDEDDGDTFSDA